MRQRLKDAASQQNISPQHGLLAYYKVIEMAVDDLIRSPPGAKPYPQAVKIEKLLKLYPHAFNVEDCVKVAHARNKLAHSDGKRFHAEAVLGKKVALWAAQCIALELVNIPAAEPKL